MASDDIRDELRAEYRRVSPLLEEARDRLLRMLETCIEGIGDQTVVRAEIRDRGQMIKKKGSFARKAITHGWTPEEAISNTVDLVRGRVVCNNVEDVRRFLELLNVRLPLGINSEIHDYIETPQEGGYRGVHLRTRFHVWRSLTPALVPVEIQIRTLLQDAWARLTHQDIYKEESELPKDLKGRSEDLATVLASAEALASRIRTRVTEERIPPTTADLSDISSDTLTYIFASKFGSNPPDYLIRSVQQLSERMGVRSLEELPAVLDDNEFREELDDIVRQRFPTGLSPEDFFRAALITIAQEREAGADFVRKRVKEEWDEIEQFARSEIAAELPETIDEFLEDLEIGRARVEEIASVLGGQTHCERCFADLIDPEAFEEALLDYYEDEETDPSGKIAEIILGSYNAPDIDYPWYCPHCAEGWRKTLAE